MAPFPRFDCPECGRRVASLYREAIFTTVGGRHQYAYLRKHKRPDGEPCPAWSTANLATVIRRPS